MRIKELTFDPQNKVFINPENIISYSDGEKNEQYIYDSLKNAKDTSIFSMELFNRIRDWSSEYHFTTYRANILRTLNIKKEHKILEIGAGCGAITRYLGETGATITAVEGSLSRARCTAERCRDLDNVTVVCSNVEDVVFDQKFDIITLIGVFEYTAKYSKHDDPFNRALQSYASLLKPNGSLVIAIENKLGLKYFSGYNEDHFAKPYFGLESRYGQKDITTFGHSEIGAMLKTAGFLSVEFQYPFPDYKLPKVVIGSQGLQDKRFNVSDLIRFTKDRHYNPRPKANLLNEYLVWESLEENDLIKDLSNSFLIVASMEKDQELTSKTFLAQYFTCNRYEPHNTVTSFHASGDASILVEKDRLGRSPQGYEKEGVTQHMNAKTSYIQGKNLHHLILSSLLKHQYAEYEALMVYWINYLIEVALLESKAETKRIKSEYFDALPFNIIVDSKNNLHLFDQEWTIDEPFDINFLMVRYLSMFRRNRGLYKGYSKNFRDFVNKTLERCGLEPISSASLEALQKRDEVIRAKINRAGGLAPLQIKKSLVFLALAKLREVKQYLYYGWFAQR